MAGFSKSRLSRTTLSTWCGQNFVDADKLCNLYKLDELSAIERLRPCGRHWFIGLLWSSLWSLQDAASGEGRCALRKFGQGRAQLVPLEAQRHGKYRTSDSHRTSQNLASN